MNTHIFRQQTVILFSTLKLIRIIVDSNTCNNRTNKYPSTDQSLIFSQSDFQRLNNF